jgi:hypothetical protein
MVKLVIVYIYRIYPLVLVSMKLKNFFARTDNWMRWEMEIWSMIYKRNDSSLDLGGFKSTMFCIY